eukprot:jgi/Botrbrau1/14337/Bobra.0222s0007.1
MAMPSHAQLCNSHQANAWGVASGPSKDLPSPVFALGELDQLGLRGLFLIERFRRICRLKSGHTSPQCTGLFLQERVHQTCRLKSGKTPPPEREKLWVQARGDIETAHERQKKQYDKHRREVVHHEGDKLVGPFTVLSRVGNVAYKLKLPPGLIWHSVFHPGTEKPQPTPLPPVIGGDMYYEVEDIVGHKVRCRHVNAKKSHDDPSRKGKPQYLYLVQWVGYPDSDNSWEPVCNFAHNAETRAMPVTRDSLSGKEWAEVTYTPTSA